MSVRYFCASRGLECVAAARADLDVADPDDPRVASYRDIRERDLVGRQGLFIAEGEVIFLC
jgi:hypothetical protein